MPEESKFHSVWLQKMGNSRTSVFPNTCAWEQQPPPAGGRSARVSAPISCWDVGSILAMLGKTLTQQLYATGGRGWGDTKPCTVNWCQRKSHLVSQISFQLPTGFQNVVVINKFHPLKKQQQHWNKTMKQRKKVRRGEWLWKEVQRTRKKTVQSVTLSSPVTYVHHSLQSVSVTPVLFLHRSQNRFHLLINTSCLEQRI